MNNDREFLGTQPIDPLLKQLAIPTVTAQLINMLYNIVDRIYIGHMPGDGSLALTGVGVCMPLIMIVSAFAALEKETAMAALLSYQIRTSGSSSTPELSFTFNATSFKSCLT